MNQKKAPAESGAKNDTGRVAGSHGQVKHSPSDEEGFKRLAALSRIQYERCRKDEARKLRIRPGILDREVDAYRPKNSNDNAQGSAVEFPEIGPWNATVNGADVLNEVASRFGYYVALPPRAADGIALWIGHTHVFEAFVHTPRLNIRSPDKGCGKTTALDVLATMCPRPLRTENMTAPVLFRLVELYKPVMLLDEVDSYLNDADELRGLLNAGHNRGARAIRCEGENNTLRSFAAFAPAALAGIGALPGTLHDRSIIIGLVRAKPGEFAARFDSRLIGYETKLCRKLARWATDNFEKLRRCDPKLPGTAFNRLADNWRPLFAIAEVAGGNWPQRAHTAFTALTTTVDLDAQGVGSLLLSDIAGLFATGSTDRLPSSDIAESLAAMEGRPWAEWGRQRKHISTNQLANQLRRFGISPSVIRVGDETARGYRRGDFEDAFARYLPKPPLSDRNNVTTLGETAISEVSQGKTVLHPENADSQGECYGVTPCKQGSGQKNLQWKDHAP